MMNPYERPCWAGPCTAKGMTEPRFCICKAREDEIAKLRRSAKKALRIIEVNLYHQREKVEDAEAILRDMAGTD